MLVKVMIDATGADTLTKFEIPIGVQSVLTSGPLLACFKSVSFGFYCFHDLTLYEQC